MLKRLYPLAPCVQLSSSRFAQFIYPLAPRVQLSSSHFAQFIGFFAAGVDIEKQLVAIVDQLRYTSHSTRRKQNWALVAGADDLSRLAIHSSGLCAKVDDKPLVHHR